MIALAQQPALERAVEDARAGRYVEAWASAEGDASARTYVRYHAGDLDGALAEARLGLQAAPADAWLLATGTEIALSLHRGAAAEELLGRWRAAAPAADEPRVAAAQSELADLRAIEREAASGIRRAQWISALAGALALALLLRLARARE